MADQLVDDIGFSHQEVEALDLAARRRECDERHHADEQGVVADAAERRDLRLRLGNGDHSAPRSDRKSVV